MVNSKICIFFLIICIFLGGIGYAFWRTCTLCRQQAIAECTAAETVSAAQLAQTQASVLMDISKTPVAQRRQILQKWVVK